MKLKILAVLLLVSLFFVGCVSTKNIPITDNRANDLRNHTAVCSDWETPDFSAYSSGKAMAGGMFGMIGGAVAANSMISEGNKIISENGVEDPADYIAEQLMSELASQYELNQLNINNITVESEEVEHISSLYKDADYVLDIRTVNWQTLPGNVGNRYRVIYSSKRRLIDTNERAVVAEGFCYKAPKQKDPQYSYEELMDNNAEGLKSQLKTKADYCVDHFKKSVFMMQ
jgi:hypothetical protein